MKLPIEFDIRAEEEAADACDFYESRRAGYGRLLTLKIDAALEAIRQNPNAGRQVSGEYRRYRLTGFPFYIYYRIDPHAILVVSIFHTSRDPKIWQSRI